MHSILRARKMFATDVMVLAWRRPTREGSIEKGRGEEKERTFDVDVKLCVFLPPVLSAFADDSESTRYGYRYVCVCARVSAHANRCHEIVAEFFIRF